MIDNPMDEGYAVRAGSRNSGCRGNREQCGTDHKTHEVSSGGGMISSSKETILDRNQTKIARALESTTSGNACITSPAAQS
jgi:hypothetical protein